MVGSYMFKWPENFRSPQRALPPCHSLGASSTIARVAITSMRRYVSLFPCFPSPAAVRALMHETSEATANRQTKRDSVTAAHLL